MNRYYSDWRLHLIQIEIFCKWKKSCRRGFVSGGWRWSIEISYEFDDRDTRSFLKLLKKNKRYIKMYDVEFVQMVIIVSLANCFLAKSSRSVICFFCECWYIWKKLLRISRMFFGKMEMKCYFLIFCESIEV